MANESKADLQAKMWGSDFVNPNYDIKTRVE